MNLKHGVSVKVHIGQFVRSTDGFTPATTVALGAADEAELLKHNTTSVVDISGRTWGAIASADGWYALTLTTADVDTPGPLTILVQDDSLCLPVHRSFDVQAANVWDSFHTTDNGYIMHSSSAGNYGGKIDNLVTDTTAITAKLPTNYIMGSSDQAARSAAIDAIETETTGLAADITNLIAATTAIWAETTGINADIANVIAATTAIWAETTGLQAKLPTSFIMGSSTAGSRAGTIDTIDTNVSGLNDISAADVTAAVPTTAEIADAVWEESSSDHNTTGTMGWYANLADEIKAGTTAIEVETSGLATDVTNLIAATTAIWAETTGLQAKLPTNFIMGSTTAGARAGVIDTINTNVSGLNDISSADVTAAVPTTAEIADAVWEESSSDHNTTGTMGWYENLADDIQAGTTAVEAETTGLNAKLPTNFIMGSTDAVARSAKIDATYTFGAHSKFRKGVAANNVGFVLTSTSDDKTPVTGATVTVKYSIDSSTWATSTGTVSEVGSGHYAFDASSSEMNGDDIILLFETTESNSMSYYIPTST